MDLVGTTEAAEILGVSRQRVYELAVKNKRFPRPVAVLASGRVWTRRSIEAFDRKWDRRRTGRPKGKARVQ